MQHELTIEANWCFVGMPSTSRGSGTSFLVQTNMEAWVGHPLDPVSVLFDTLLEASKEEENPQNMGRLKLST